MTDDRKPTPEERIAALEREVERLTSARDAPARPLEDGDIGTGMQMVFLLAVFGDWLARLTNKRWREISKGNPPGSSAWDVWQELRKGIRK